jgi:hypothetical protein
MRRRIVPGGTSGLQIRVGPSDGPWWVRLPSSSAIRPCSSSPSSSADSWPGGRCRVALWSPGPLVPWLGAQSVGSGGDHSGGRRIVPDHVGLTITIIVIPGITTKAAGERVAVAVTDDESRPIQLVGFLDGPGRREATLLRHGGIKFSAARRFARRRLSARSPAPVRGRTSCS